MSSPNIKLFLGKPCPYCGVKMHRDLGLHHPDAPSRDHKIPKCRGGAGLRNNIHVVCRHCNSDKANLTHEEYIAVRAGRACRLDIMLEIKHKMEADLKYAHRRPYKGPTIASIYASWLAGDIRAKAASGK